jgi:hypothetical protein
MAERLEFKQKLLKKKKGKEYNRKAIRKFDMRVAARSKKNLTALPLHCAPAQ